MTSESATDIHPGELRPDLREGSDVRPVDVSRREELEKASRLGLTLDLDPFLDLLELVSYKWAVRVSVAVREDEDLLALLPSIFGREPAWRLGEEHHAEEEDDRRNHLKSPWHAEGGRTIHERAAIGDVLLNEVS